MSRFHRIVALLTLVPTTGLSAADGASPLVDAVKRGDHDAVRDAAARARRTSTPPERRRHDGAALRGAGRRPRARHDAAARRARTSRPPTATACRRSRWPRRTAARRSIDALLEAGADPNTRTAAGEPVIMTAARTGNVDALKRADRPRRQRQRAREVVRRDGRHVGGRREPRRRDARARRGGCRSQRAIDGPRRARARVPAQRRSQLAVPARRLDAR